MNYIDTSLVIAAMDNSVHGGGKRGSREALTMLSRTGDKVVSELFLVELAAAISRRPELISALPTENVQPETVLLAYLVYIMAKFDLKLLSPSSELITTPLGRVTSESGSSLAMAPGLKLRSLDLLHISHLISIKDRGFNVESLLTSDGDFRRAESFLKGHNVKLIVLEP